MSIKTLSADIAFYGVLDLLQRSIGVIMIPIYTRVFTLKEYGDLDIIVIFSSVLLVLVDLQYIAGFSRLYYEHRASGTDKRFVGTAIVSRLLGGIAIPAAFLALGFLGDLKFNFLPSFKANGTTWMLAVAAIPISLTYEILLLQARMLRWKKWFIAGSISNAVLACTLSAYFAVSLGLGIGSVVLGMLIGSLTGLALLGWGLRKEIELCFDVGIFKEINRYSMPLIPGWWLAFASAYICRFFVFAELGADENAILAVCMKIAGGIGMFIAAFQTAWQPLAMAHIGEASGERFYTRSMRLFIASGIFCIFILTAFLDAILLLVPGSYHVARYYVPLFAVGMLLSGFANNLQLGNLIAKTTHWVSLSVIVSVAVNVAMLIIFTKRFGIAAAGFAWVVSFAVKDLMTYLIAQRSYRIPYDNRSILLMIFGCGLLLLLVFFNYRFHITGWIFTGCVSLTGMLISWFVFEALERQEIRKYFKQRLCHV